MDNFGDILKGSLGEKCCNVRHNEDGQLIPETLQVGLSRTAIKNGLRNGCGVLSGQEHLTGSGR